MDDIKRNCSKGPNGIHTIAMGPEAVAELLCKKEITMEEAMKAQFCVYCGKEIW